MCLIFDTYRNMDELIAGMNIYFLGGAVPYKPFHEGMLMVTFLFMPPAESLEVATLPCLEHTYLQTSLSSKL